MNTSQNSANKVQPEGGDGDIEMEKKQYEANQSAGQTAAPDDMTKDGGIARTKSIVSTSFQLRTYIFQIC